MIICGRCCYLVSLRPSVLHLQCYSASVLFKDISLKNRFYWCIFYWLISFILRNMALQKHIFLATQQYISRCSILQPTLRQSYCALRHKYSTEASEERKFTDRHEWVVVKNNVGTVGISKYAQESLGDVVFAQLPEAGTEIKAGDECGALESVKAASEIYSPVTGTVTEKNKEVESKPGLINTSCYDQGWLFKLKLSDPAEVSKLMNEEQYETFLKTDAEKDH